MDKRTMMRKYKLSDTMCWELECMVDWFETMDKDYRIGGPAERRTLEALDDRGLIVIEGDKVVDVSALGVKVNEATNSLSN